VSCRFHREVALSGPSIGLKTGWLLTPGDWKGNERGGSRSSIGSNAEGAAQSKRISAMLRTIDWSSESCLILEKCLNAVGREEGWHRGSGAKPNGRAHGKGIALYWRQHTTDLSGRGYTMPAGRSRRQALLLTQRRSGASEGGECRDARGHKLVGGFLAGLTLCPSYLRRKPGFAAVASV